MARIENEIAAAEKAIRKHKLSDVRVEIVGEGVIADKFRFFDGYPDLVELRDRIRAEFAGEL